MRAVITCYSTNAFEHSYLESAAKSQGMDIRFLEVPLTVETAKLAAGSRAILCWAHDQLDANTLQSLRENGVEMVSLRTAGFSHLDLKAAERAKLCVTRVPAYSPEAVAEFAFGLLMCLNRKYHRAFQRIRDFDFRLEGLLGSTLHGKTIGVIGAGQIGKAFVRIARGFGCRVLVSDVSQDSELTGLEGVTYTNLETLLRESDAVSLHCPLNRSTQHLIREKTLALMKPGAYLINTGRGGLIQSKDLIATLKERKLGGVALDVYEFEEDVFFKDLTDEGISDDMLARLMTFPNVLITSHQAFFTHEALANIATTSIHNVRCFVAGQTIPSENVLLPGSA